MRLPALDRPAVTSLAGDDAARRDAVRRLLDPAARARFVGDELIAHYAAVLDEFPVNSDVRVATPGPVSARPHVA